MPRPAKTALPAIPEGAIIGQAERKPQSDTARICAAYLNLLDAIEKYGGGFEFPMQDNPTGNPGITYRNTAALQGFYAAIQLPDYEISHMLRGDPEHKMIEEKRAAIKVLVERIEEA